MKLLITGLAQETDFANPEKTRTILVIDGGGLRVPIDETSVKELIEYALSSDVQTIVKVKPSNGHTEEEEEAGEAEPDEDDVTDEAGISQI